MKHSIVALMLGFAVAGCSCTDAERASESSQSGRAEISGTVLDRATGNVVSGARVETPDGRRTKSDAAGRFLIKDLEPGLAGPLTARLDDGRDGSVPLRPLTAGRLEVVLFVGR